MKIPAAALGFIIAAIAGLTLAVIGRPGEQAVAQAIPPRASSQPAGFVLKSVSVDLPTSTATFPAGPNVDVVSSNCLSCHSAGMVLTQPTLSKASWAGIVDKMIHAYKAPVDAGEAAAIVDYLVETKGTK